MTWKIGLMALSLLLAILILSDADAPEGATRDLSRVACYIALANDLTPLLQNDAPELASTSRQCDEERLDGRSAEGPAIPDVAPWREVALDARNAVHTLVSGHSHTSVSIDSIVQYLVWGGRCYMASYGDLSWSVWAPGLRQSKATEWRDAMYILFAKHSYGRIVLHLMAMISDGQVRWHCAGIVREMRF